MAPTTSQTRVQAPEEHTVSSQHIQLCVTMFTSPVQLEGSQRQKPILFIS